jgi:ribosome-associated protein
VEAVFDVEASRALDARQRDLLLGRGGSLITAVSQDSRGQARNRELALKRLAEKIATGLDEPVRRRSTRPTRASRERRLEEKRRAGERKRGRRRPGGDY